MSTRLEEFLKYLMALGVFLVTKHMILVDGDQQKQLKHRVCVLAVVKWLIVEEKFEELWIECFQRRYFLFK